MSTANISAKDVMALRQKTGLGMMDCKKALVEANGDLATAETHLREKLKGKMDERTDRAAGEGCIAVKYEGDKAAILEVRSETDFTARNEMFVAMANEGRRHVPRSACRRDLLRRHHDRDARQCPHHHQ